LTKKEGEQKGSQERLISRSVEGGRSPAKKGGDRFLRDSGPGGRKAGGDQRGGGYSPYLRT